MSNIVKPLAGFEPKEYSNTLAETQYSFNHYTIKALVFGAVNTLLSSTGTCRYITCSNQHCHLLTSFTSVNVLKQPKDLVRALIKNEEEIDKVSVVHTHIDFSEARHHTQYFTQSMKPQIPRVAQVSSSSDTSPYLFLLDSLCFGIYEQQEQTHSESALVTYVFDQANDNIEDHPDLPGSTIQPGESVSITLHNVSSDFLFIALY
ncbi:hypothetical protein GYMLUDRAFT_55558 [Collybiopsis luxurians FD-317 M1]|nr:hypothetical protein GYMLUDRAFT_55558 [Collybiopsis luxurians FD-317 M1]